MPDKTILVVSPFRDQVKEALEKGRQAQAPVEIQGDAIVNRPGRGQAKPVAGWRRRDGLRLQYHRGRQGQEGGEDGQGNAGLRGSHLDFRRRRHRRGHQDRNPGDLSTEKTAKQTAQYIQEDVNQGVQRAFQASLKEKQFDPLREYLRQLEAVAKGKTLPSAAKSPPRNSRSPEVRGPAGIASLEPAEKSPRVPAAKQGRAARFPAPSRSSLLRAADSRRRLILSGRS